MKRAILILVAVAAILPFSINAQTGLKINDLFGKHYRDMEGVSETMVKGRMQDMNLSLYHSMTFTDHSELAPTIEKLVASDGAAAQSKEVRYKNGRLYYGFYQLSRKADGTNRYILYLNRHLVGDKRIMLLYLEGKASVDEVKKILK